MKREARVPDPGVEKSSEERTWGKFSLLVKLNLTIGISFLLTMAVFLSLSYRSEREFQIDHSTRLLGAVLEALATQIPDGRSPDAEEIGALQARLNGSGVHRYRLFILSPTGRVVAAGERHDQGRLFTELFPRHADALARSGGALVSDGKANWLLTSKSLNGTGTLLLLLDWRHIASNLRSFRAIHGTHLLATLALFFLLLWIVTERFVRARLRGLQRAIQQIEMGRWDAHLEVGSRDEFGWLYSRFKEMAHRLKENVDRLVRVEKYASAAIIVLRVGQELKGPLNAVWSNLSSLAELAHREPAVGPIAADLRHNWQQVDASIRKLSEIQRPQEWGV